MGSLVLPQNQLTITRLGRLDGTGNLVLGLNAPTLPVSVSIVSFYIQGLFLSVSPAEIALSTPTQVHVFGPGF